MNNRNRFGRPEYFRLSLLLAFLAISVGGLVVCGSFPHLVSAFRSHPWITSVLVVVTCLGGYGCHYLMSWDHHSEEDVQKSIERHQTGT